ncbi:hypothetical protein [Micromonospora sp. WMMD998]|uniref:hypothetical protein n=1 Tax=Micromonospora sp. WMMD998 TaxID=3016092 RepID=UPI00249ADA3F|nr:hypothetical protein [Micromonospora sp. WMMD998]WFE38741.1 hypothetical protein O7619_10000 [Micromonospora sp. WMMD998]
MRFVRTIAGVLLLAVGIPALLAGVGLWHVARHADPADGYAARFGGLELALRGELRAGWFPAVVWALLAGGTLLTVLAVALLLRPHQPREVVFVVEPEQVPVLAGRLGITSLHELGRQPGPRSAPERHLVAVGSPAGGRTRAPSGGAPETAGPPRCRRGGPSSPGDSV